MKDAVSWLVRLQFHPELSDYFVSLTGITQADVEGKGIPFPDAFEHFLGFVGGLPAAAFGGDWQNFLRRNCERYGILTAPHEGRFVDIRPALCRHFKLDSRAVMSGDLPTILGFPSVGRGHDALADARAVSGAIRRVLERPS